MSHVKLHKYMLCLWYSLRALLICRVIKQSTLLCRYPDLRTFEMNEDTDCSVRKQIMNRTNRKKEGERLG